MRLRKRKPIPRGKARRDIIDAANGLLARSPYQLRRLSGRKAMAEAVCIVRRKLLVTDETLKAAGYQGVTVGPARRMEPWGGRSSYTPKKVRK